MNGALLFFQLEPHFVYDNFSSNWTKPQFKGIKSISDTTTIGNRKIIDFQQKRT